MKIAETFYVAEDAVIIIIIIIYSLKIGAGQQGRISGTYNCPQQSLVRIVYLNVDPYSLCTDHANKTVAGVRLRPRIRCCPW